MVKEETGPATVKRHQIINNFCLIPCRSAFMVMPTTVLSEKAITQDSIFKTTNQGRQERFNNKTNYA